MFILDKLNLIKAFPINSYRCDLSDVNPSGLITFLISIQGATGSTYFHLKTSI